MPRFAVLAHDWPTPHWDFLLEAGPALRAWRLLDHPTGPGGARAEPNFDHRAIYLDYEGPLSGGRGAVARWDGGTFEWARDEPDLVAVDLAGTVLRGRAELRRTAAGWLFAAS